MNIPEYFRRIRIEEDIRPTLTCLQTLQRQHLLHIPFENFDIHTGTPIQLDIDRICHKIIEQKRGGFCYELNGLFYALLQEIGFEVKRVAGRVFHEGQYGPEYDHLAIMVHLEGQEYLVDVGFGEFAFHPLPIELGTRHVDERGIYSFDLYEQCWRINKETKGTLKPEYIFEKQAREYHEFEPMCIHHQTSPDSHFTQKEFITIPFTGGRITLSDDQLKITKGDAVTKKEVTEEEKGALLVKYFHFAADQAY